MFYNAIVNYPYVENVDQMIAAPSNTVVTRNPSLKSERKTVIYLPETQIPMLRLISVSPRPWGNCIIYEAGGVQLFLSDYMAACNKDFLNFFNIRNSINLSQMPGILDGLVIDIYDDPGQNIKQYFNQCNEFINDKKTVLVFCAAGISRSSTICISYLMSTGKSFNEAYEFVAKCRPIIRPNPGFIQQLNSILC